MSDTIAIKALSLWQPWAALVAAGAKRFETRSWATSYRGPLLICSAKKWNVELMAMLASEPVSVALAQATQIHFGFALCIVDLVEVYVTQHPVGTMLSSAGQRVCLPVGPERGFGDYSPGRFAWELSNLRPLHERSFKVRGRQQLFNVEIDPKLLEVSQ